MRPLKALYTGSPALGIHQRKEAVYMLKQELIKRSPLRILEQSTHGGLGRGNIGVIASPKGVGKTACLVNISLDTMLQGKQVLHISFSEDAHHIISWYENIFRELSSCFGLDRASDIFDECRKNRIIMHFAQAGMQITAIEKSIETLITNSHFNAQTIIIDGYNFKKSSSDDMLEFKRFAEKLDCELWFSASVPEGNGGFDGSSVPQVLEPFINELAIIICLQPHDRFIRINLIKDHATMVRSDLHLKLDPGLLLITEQK